MDPANRNAAIAAALIMLGFGLLFYYMPQIMVAVGDTVSPAAALGVGALAVLSFFGIFWLRGRMKRGEGEE